VCDEQNIVPVLPIPPTRRLTREEQQRSDRIRRVRRQNIGVDEEGVIEVVENGNEQELERCLCRSELKLQTWYRRASLPGTSIHRPVLRSCQNPNESYRAAASFGSRRGFRGLLSRIPVSVLVFCNLLIAH
jgi:hypothetical protein